MQHCIQRTVNSAGTLGKNIAIGQNILHRRFHGRMYRKPAIYYLRQNVWRGPKVKEQNNAVFARNTPPCEERAFRAPHPRYDRASGKAGEGGGRLGEKVREIVGTAC
eukprot:4468971-Pleurochrysis_carterae.AAC.1